MQPMGVKPADATSTRSTPSWLQSVRRTLFGLQFKATVLVVALLLVVASPLCGLAVRQAWELANRLDRERVMQHAKMVAKLSSELLAQGRVEDLKEMASEIATGDPVCFIHVSDADGRQVALVETAPGIAGHYTPEVRSGRLIGVPLARVWPAGAIQFWDVTYPIHRDSYDAAAPAAKSMALLGHVRLGMTRNQTIANFAAAADLVVGIAVAVVLATIPLGFFVVRRIAVPLEEMSEVARRFSAGDRAARCTVRRLDEIGRLGASLNAMADEVTRTHNEIVHLNADLEQRVMERTSQLRELASREPLTGLYNRRHMSEVLARRFAEARRYGGDLSLMMIDMDNFKSVNDRFGHQVGDELLILTALTITSQLRSADVAARLGGDEFIVLLPHSTSEQAKVLGRRIARRFRRDVRAKYHAADVSISIGVASLSACDARTDEAFIRAADRALYEAKAAGKDRVVLAGAVSQ